MPQCFAVHTEKELVGKIIQSSKVKVLWQIAFDDVFVVHNVELKHSVVSGKREVLFDNQVVYTNKALFHPIFNYRSKLAGHDVRLTLEDTFEGYVYDLFIDNVMFHRMPRKTLVDLENLRAKKKSDVTVQTDFSSFTGKSKSLLDAIGSKNKEKETTKVEESLIELDWDSAVKLPEQGTISVQAAQFNPFDSSFVASSSQPQGSYIPFGEIAHQPSY